MPIAGAVAWSAAGVFGAILRDEHSASIALFLCMPAVFPLALLISRLTGEDVFGAQGRNELDQLFGFGSACFMPSRAASWLRWRGSCFRTIASS
jgi:hypothetical protein